MYRPSRNENEPNYIELTEQSDEDYFAKRFNKISSTCWANGGRPPSYDVVMDSLLAELYNNPKIHKLLNNPD